MTVIFFFLREFIFFIFLHNCIRFAKYASSNPRTEREKGSEAGKDGEQMQSDALLCGHCFTMNHSGSLNRYIH